MEEVYCWKFTIIRDDGAILEVGLLKEAELVGNSAETQRDADLRVLGSSCLVVDGGFLTAFVYSDSSIKVRRNIFLFLFLNDGHTRGRYC